MYQFDGPLVREINISLNEKAIILPYLFDTNEDEIMDVNSFMQQFEIGNFWYNSLPNIGEEIGTFYIDYSTNILTFTPKYRGYFELASYFNFSIGPTISSFEALLIINVK